MLKELEKLNPVQREAAETFYGPLLLLAGAGSGKTTTVVTRIANMIHNGIPGSKILVMTFTNKAAKEMKVRAEKMLGSSLSPVDAPTLTTFHGWCFGFIKEHIRLSREGLTESTQVADESTTKAIVKSIQSSALFQAYVKKATGVWDDEMKKLKVEGFFTILQNKICPYKKIEETVAIVKSIAVSCNIQGKDFINPNDDVIIRYVSALYMAYKTYLRRNNLIDFDDLVNLSIRVISENEDIKNSLRTQYEYITVDEFQDTNYAQMVLLNLLIGEKENICVVGDDSQSIYGWRGAEIDYILDFSKEFKKAKVFNLNINYRSTGNIIDVANTLLGSAVQKHSLKETLVPHSEERGVDECVRLYNDTTEAIYVASEIKQSLRRGVEPGEIAILYRNNNIPKGFEGELIKQRIPYHIFKGRTLLKRKAVTEFMALIRFLVNKKDQISLFAYFAAAKILSEAKIKDVTEIAYERGHDFLEVVREEMFSSSSKVFSKANKASLEAFFNAVNGFDTLLSQNAESQEIYAFINSAFSLVSVYIKTEASTKSEKTASEARSSIEALETITNLMLEYPNLETFLEEMVLSADAKDDSIDGKVSLMTVHASKGLEFEEVYLVRFNNGVFPSDKSLSFGVKGLEEERRLAYVAITRAKRKIVISYVERIYGKEAAPSLFIREAGLTKKCRSIRINLPR